MKLRCHLILCLVLCICMLLTPCALAAEVVADAKQERTTTQELVCDVKGNVWLMPACYPIHDLTPEQRELLLEAGMCKKVNYLIKDTRENKEIIWDYLYEKFHNAYGVAGLMGNIYLESGFSPTNLQGTYERKFGMSDWEYTRAVDNGTYGNFVYDSAGYGLVQWTWWSWKAELLEFAKSRGTSIGDMNTQLDLMYRQLENHSSNVYNNILKAKDVRQAAVSVMLDFEKPGNQSWAAQQNRTNAGIEVYNELAYRAEIVDMLPQYIEDLCEQAEKEIAEQAELQVMIMIAQVGRERLEAQRAEEEAFNRRVNELRQNMNEVLTTIVTTWESATEIAAE